MVRPKKGGRELQNFFLKRGNLQLHRIDFDPRGGKRGGPSKQKTGRGDQKDRLYCGFKGQGKRHSWKGEREKRRSEKAPSTWKDPGKLSDL